MRPIDEPDDGPRDAPDGEAWDEAAWATLAQELAAWQERGRRATLWWRDDDAGAAGPALERLLGLAGRLTVPVGLAVVPAWLTPEAEGLIQNAPPGVAVLQHGFAHQNHETVPTAEDRPALRPAKRAGQIGDAPPAKLKIRPAELGAARRRDVVLGELALGQARLATAFPRRFVSVLVPPWNRIAPSVRAALPAVGYRGVSAFGPRPRVHPADGPVTVNCHVDPILWREGKRFRGARALLDGLRLHLASRRRGEIDPAEPTGLLTHHRDMTPSFWHCLEELWGRLVPHAGAHLLPIPGFLSPPDTPEPRA